MGKLNQLFLFLFIFVFAVLSVDTEITYGPLGLALSILMGIPVANIARLALEEYTQKRKRVQKYGKYLRAAGLPEDIKDVLGKFISFKIRILDVVVEKSCLIIGYSYTSDHLKLSFPEEDYGPRHLWIRDGRHPSVEFTPSRRDPKHLLEEFTIPFSEKETSTKLMLYDESIKIF